MNKAVWPLLTVVIAGLVIAFLFWRQETEVTPESVPAVVETEQAPAPVPLAEPEPPPVIPEELETPLPPLDESDDTIRDTATELAGQWFVAELLVPKEIARKLVVTMDNLPREKVSMRVRVVKDLPGRFATSGSEEFRTISEENFARYRAVVEIVQGIDAGNAVDLYLRFYPLLQEAYAELGYSGRQFNNRLIEVIDDMLAAPRIETPISLVQPKVMYEYADPDLEARSAGQKILIRMGVVNADVVKAKLREIRKEILDRTAGSAGQ